MRAALAIQRALAELNRENADTGKPVLNARIGLETGPAVVDAAGEIYGDVANIAARVQALAEPGAVLVTARVQRQVAGLFVAEERGSHKLKGVPEQTALFRMVRASGGGRRSGQRNLTPLVGRDDETAMLLRRWERARQGDGQLVLIVGEPGLGKSRLIEEFHARLSDTPHTWVEWSCSQLLQNTPLHPVAEWGRQRFGSADVPAAQRLAELESSLVQVKLDPAENVPLLAPLLEIPLPPDRVPSLAPEELRRRQLAALTGWVMAGARAQALVLAFEDIHWADPTTLDVLRGIAERGARAPLFVVATTRPEFRPPWSMRSHHGTISLAPLDRLQVREMVAELSARHALPREVVEDVAARTGGVPLFVEEVTRLLLERGEGGGGIQAIPATLQQSLMARLDRLGPARELAQIGSVIGRGFSYSLLCAVAGMQEQALQQGLPPESDYRFKHALIQDAAYENLLKSRRQVLHRRVAEILRDKFADGVAAEPELLAHHFTQAGLTEAAIEWWGKAGQRSLERSALVEATEQLTRALTQIAKLPATPALRREEIKLQVALITPLIHVKGYAAPETKAAAEKARQLIEQAEALGEPTEDPLLLFAVLYGFWVANFVAFNSDVARELAAQFLTLAEKQRTTVPLMIGHRLMATSLLETGDIAEGRAHFDQAIALYDPVAHRSAGDAIRSRRPDGHPVLAVAGFVGTWLSRGCARGHRERAQGCARDRASRYVGVCAGRRTVDPHPLRRLCDSNNAIRRTCRFGGRNRRLVLEAAGHDKSRLAIGSDWPSLECSPGDELRDRPVAGNRSNSLAYLPYLARAYAKLGQFDDAWRCIGEAMTAVETTKEKWCEADTPRPAVSIGSRRTVPIARRRRHRIETAGRGAALRAREKRKENG